jgi:hypothetical protein
MYCSAAQAQVVPVRMKVGAQALHWLLPEPVQLMQLASHGRHEELPVAMYSPAEQMQVDPLMTRGLEHVVQLVEAPVHVKQSGSQNWQVYVASMY